MFIREGRGQLFRFFRVGFLFVCYKHCHILSEAYNITHFLIKKSVSTVISCFQRKPSHKNLKSTLPID